ncbi:hypothetical protein GC173_04945 [bacterium]|nr:hypothetical protein [bacterium]
MKKMFLLATIVATVAATSGSPGPAQQIVEITNSYTGETLANNKLFVPEGDGPFPAVVVMHGSGGLWSNDNVQAGVMTGHFEEWAETFTDAGYIALFVDSYTPRGLVTFSSKRPSDNPLVDDALASDRLVRPQDAYSALAFLRERDDVIDNRVALMGFSQGAQSVLAAVVDPSVTQFKTNWTVSREVVQANGTYKKTTVAANQPVTVSNPATEGFATVIAYYPGCGFNSYFGGSSSTVSKLYMPYAPTLMIHGDQDPLYADNLYPVAFTNKSKNHANFIGRAAHALPITDANDQPVVTNNPLYHEIVPGLAHSFDELDPDEDGYDEMIATRAKVVAWLDEYLN